MRTLKENIRAVMFGHAVADALGVPVEFCSRGELMDDPVTTMAGFGTYPVPAGSWSDDTSMSIAALDHIASGGLDWQVIMGNFGRWYYDGKYTPTDVTFDVGGTCARAIEAHFVHGQAPLECGLADEYSNGNGSLMRIHPFSLMAYARHRDNGSWENIIAQASALTHSHERSVLACKIYTLILFHLLDKPNKQSVRVALQCAARDYGDSEEIGCYSRLFEADFDRLSVGEIRSSGYVVDTLEAAVWCLLTTDNYRDCVLRAVNLGEDTDTVAAVAGGLAGALYGYEAIPEEWLSTLIRRDMIEEMCERAAESWNPTEKKRIEADGLCVVDLHIHVVPSVDDGATDIEESLALLRMSAEQGVTDVFCTSHNGYSREEGERYRKAFLTLKRAVEKENIPVRLYEGCEVLCAGEYIDDIVYGLDCGAFATLGTTKYMLTELYPDTRPTEAFSVIKTLCDHGYHPIIAHMERNYNLTGVMVSTLITMGALIQVNAYSFVEERDVQMRERARRLLRNQQIHFLGSDAHRLAHRPPNVASGVQYVLEHAEEEYAKEVLCGNAEKLLGI